MSDSGRERPNCKHGHDSQCPHCEELATLRTRLAAAEARAASMEGALRWALGEGDSDFGVNLPENAGRYWWRTELRKRAALGIPLTH